jgi:hypothetical protein
MDDKATNDLNEEMKKSPAYAFGALDAAVDMFLRGSMTKGDLRRARERIRQQTSGFIQK